ncbi:hypothetical protein StoSoilB20_08680 [Arthrobacter sp. StoSoilB20]|nr:hypothetical protein StoSoilB20_08680 [Arthrobacter sp. StoSoilB20]
MVIWPQREVVRLKSAIVELLVLAGAEVMEDMRVFLSCSRIKAFDRKRDHGDGITQAGSRRRDHAPTAR